MYFYGGLALAVAVAVVMAVKVRGAREPSARAKLVAGLNSFWGVVTILFFAPAGCLAALFGFDKSALAGSAITAVSLDGFALGIALFVASRRLLKHRKLDRVKAIATWSIVHHVAVVLAFFPLDDDVAFACMLPCSLGIALAIGLIRRANAPQGYDAVTTF